MEADINKTYLSRNINTKEKGKKQKQTEFGQEWILESQSILQAGAVG